MDFYDELAHSDQEKSDGTWEKMARQRHNPMVALEPGRRYLWRGWQAITATNDLCEPRFEKRAGALA
jgi:hypothetical protein